MASSFIWCRKKSYEIILTWIPGSYCQNLIGYYQCVSEPIYGWHFSKAKRTLYKRQNYEKVLDRWRTKKWRKVRGKEKQRVIPVLDESSSSKNTEVLTPQESLGSSRVEKSLSRHRSKREKPSCNNNIISDKANSTIQVDAKHFSVTFR